MLMSICVTLVGISIALKVTIVFLASIEVPPRGAKVVWHLNHFTTLLTAPFYREMPKAISISLVIPSHVYSIDCCCLDRKSIGERAFSLLDESLKRLDSFDRQPQLFCVWKIAYLTDSLDRQPRM